MPIENEYKYLLCKWTPLEQALAIAHPTCGLLETIGTNDRNPVGIRQGYLTPELRLREVSDRSAASGETVCYFTFKRRLRDGRNIEIETVIPQSTFDLLWVDTNERLAKRRWSFANGEVRWDVDFFEESEGDTYFAMAEAEMGDETKELPAEPSILGEHITCIVGREDARFSSRSLANIVLARSLASAYNSAG